MSEFKDIDNIRQLYETDLYILLSEYDDTFLVEKKQIKNFGGIGSGERNRKFILL